MAMAHAIMGVAPSAKGAVIVIAGTIPTLVAVVIKRSSASSADHNAGNESPCAASGLRVRGWNGDHQRRENRSN